MLQRLTENERQKNLNFNLNPRLPADGAKEKTHL